jgi:glycosyltransferase involved in cell wall biosynthesis
LNLLHICCNYGVSRVYVDLFTHLAALGEAQRVYVPEKRADRMGRNLPEGEAFPVEYRRIVRPWDVALYHTKARRVAPDIARRVNLAEVDLIHAHTLFTDGGIAYRLHRERGVPYVVSVRMTDLAYFFRYMPHLRGHGRRILRAARKVVFLSQSGRDTLLERYLSPTVREEVRAKCVVISNGLSEAWFEGATPRSWEAGQPLRVAFAGKLERNKQPLAALQAVLALGELLPGTPISLHMAGEGPLAQALGAHPAAVGGAVKLELCGRLEGIEAMRDFYDGCHLFLLPSLAETFGLVYLEAMSRGLPVLYTRGQGFDGPFPQGSAGSPVEPGDPTDMARAALRLLEGYPERSARCIELARDRTWDRSARRMAALYDEAKQEET